MPKKQAMEKDVIIMEEKKVLSPVEAILEAITEGIKASEEADHGPKFSGAVLQDMARGEVKVLCNILRKCNLSQDEQNIVLKKLKEEYLPRARKTQKGSMAFPIELLIKNL